MNTQRQLSEEIRICRICLEVDNELMISPCKCLGSVKNVHINCLKTWIAKEKQYNPTKLRHISGTYYQIPCQICKGNIGFNSVKENKCISCMEFNSMVKDNCFSIVCAFVWLLVFGGLAGFLLALSIQEISKNSSGLGIMFFMIFFITAFIFFLKMVKVIADFLIVEGMSYIEIKHSPENQ